MFAQLFFFSWRVKDYEGFYSEIINENIWRQTFLLNNAVSAFFISILFSYPEHEKLILGIPAPEKRRRGGKFGSIRTVGQRGWKFLEKTRIATHSHILICKYNQINHHKKSTKKNYNINNGNSYIFPTRRNDKTKTTKILNIHKTTHPSKDCTVSSQLRNQNIHTFHTGERPT